MRTTLRMLTALGALALFIVVPDASAQRRRGLSDVTPPSDRHGAWLSFSLGAGWENYRYTNVPTGYQPQDNMQPSFAIAAGGTVNPHLRLGGEINAWVDEYTDHDGYHITESLVGGLLVGQVYPMRNAGLFLKGGLGISRSGADISGGTGTGETGFAYQVGAGYELKLSRNFYLTPAVTLLQHRSNQSRNDPDNLGSLHERVLTVGVGLTFQPGR